MWLERDKYIGYVDLNVTTRIIFRSTESLDVEKIEVSCGCAEAVYNPESRELRVNFTPRKVPKEFKNLDHYPTKKSVRLYLKGGAVEKLYFKARVNI